MICDFCSSPEVIGGYPAKDFTVDFYGSRGGFAVCKECKEIIEQNDRTTLLKKSVESFESIYGTEIPEFIVLDFIRPLHSMFFEHRTGCFEILA
jgi:hypothetical protein